MQLFLDLFPIIAQKETLAVRVAGESVPNGIYSFNEYYCDNLSCRCTTVILQAIYSDVNHPEKGQPIASINYDWKQPLSLKNPVLHEEESTSDMTEAAINVFRQALKEDKFYNQQVKEHFEMVKEHVRVEKRLLSNTSNKPSKFGRNNLCHCGSGKKYKKCCLKK